MKRTFLTWVALIIPFHAFAGFMSWTTNGPHGAGPLSLIAVDPSNSLNVLTASPATGTLFRTTDGGSSWAIAATFSNGLSGVRIDPANGQRVFEYYLSGVEESTDGGSTWQFDGNGINSIVQTIVFDPSSPDRIFAGTMGGVYLTTNGGGVWNLVSLTGLSNSNVTALTIDPASPSTLFAGTNGGGIFISTDSGSSWTARGSTLQNTTINILALDPTNPTTLYTYTSAPTMDLFKSTDSGVTWAPAETGLGSLDISSFAIDPVTTANLYVSTASTGVWKSTDGGASWFASASGLPVGAVPSIGIDSATGTTLYTVDATFGVYKSTNGGGAWSVTGNFPVLNFSVPTSHPSNPAIVYASAWGLFRSVDGGDSWIPLSSYASGALAIDPVMPQVMYTGGPAKSTDGGATWIQMSNMGGLTNPQVVLDPENHNTLYVFNNLGLEVSTDGGGSFAPLPNAGSQICGLAVDPTNSMTLYQGKGCRFGAGAYKSINGGASWFSIGLSAAPVGGFVIDPVNSLVIYALTSPLSLSTDGGSTWNPAGNGLPGNFADAVVLDPTNPSTLYACQGGSGVFNSTDGAATWQPMNNGLTNLQAFSLAISITGRSLHVGTSDGVWDFNFDFLDVPLGNPFHNFVNRIAMDGVSAGCADAYFCPADPVLRSQMAVFLLRGEHGPTYTPPPCAGIFGDVTCPSPFAGWIEQLYVEGITGGCSTNPLMYCPSNSVTRAGMAVFLLVAQHGTGYTPPACTGIFADVACPSPFADWIEQLYTEGITGGCSTNPLSYCPNSSVTRAQMAVFLTVTFALP